MHFWCTKQTFETMQIIPESYNAIHWVLPFSWLRIQYLKSYQQVVSSPTKICWRLIYTWLKWDLATFTAFRHQSPPSLIVWFEFKKSSLSTMSGDNDIRLIWKLTCVSVGILQEGVADAGRQLYFLTSFAKFGQREPCFFHHWSGQSSNGAVLSDWNWNTSWFARSSMPMSDFNVCAPPRRNSMPERREKDDINFPCLNYSTNR